ncbi:putative toxin-antitoxin system toxin component, PIN family [Pseudomonas aeruginosa]|uniref:putative toxin-antitoxin system toxin component, PIN family n=1 Tax=Pseudomonas aeruginosa TaxID=287 RepID=UPI000F7D7569|nr:putative toxin-antitoxin system toxin component, PIN family [Pseudomonas aeruginosa]RTB44147.1 putative toxin-antitoxin system toxin component, PIN family [Pseudomonas aeruginosa]
MSLRIVLDTNIVLSSLLFTSGRLAWIRLAWQQEKLIPLVCKETTQELLRVLAYPKFKLSPEEREELLGDFLPYAETVAMPPPWPQLPECRDKKDQIFLILAQVAEADALVSGDMDLLSMQGTLPYPIISAEELSGMLKQ